MGPLGGIYAGLTEAAFETVFVTAVCDMPLFDAAFAKQLIERVEEHEAVVPCCDGRLQPLCSVVRRTPALSQSEWLLRHKERRLSCLFLYLDTNYWTCEDNRRFYNINYPADYSNLLADERKRVNNAEEKSSPFST